MARSLPLAVGSVVLGALLAPVLVSSGASTVAVQAPPVVAAAATTSALGYDRLTLRRSDRWLLQPDLDGGAYTSYADATSSWRPVAGDTDGDGNDSLSLFRNGWWKLRNSPTGPVTTFHFGLTGDIPVLGDWDGDGVDTIGVFRRGTWYVRNSNTSGLPRSFRFGRTGDRPVVGDWNGDSRTDIGVVRGSVWYQRDAVSAGTATRSFSFGLSGDRVMSGDWDHDGVDTPAVWSGGTWSLRRTSGATSSVQKRTFGRTGDIPLVRRTQGLAPGVTHRVIHRNGSIVNVLSIQLGAASSVDPVLSNGTLRGLETTSSMARRSGAVAAVNGDFGLSNGRPVHAFSRDGELLQTPQVKGRAMGIDATGTRISMGYPDARATLHAGTASMSIPRWNSGGVTAGSLAAFTSAGAGLEVPRAGNCYASLSPAGARTVHPDGRVDLPVTVSGKRCGGTAAAVPSRGALVEGSRYNASGTFLDRLHAGQSAKLTQSTGFPGAVDVIGGNPILVFTGLVKYPDVDGTDAFSRANPRTAVGQTRDGRLLIVTVDGRGTSAGMTLRQLADFMLSLGGVNDLNLDGGGSTTMWVNGVVVNRPSDGAERAVSSALVVLPGKDPGEASLRLAPTTTTTAALERLPAPAEPLVSPVVGGTPVAGWAAAANDPGSVGGLAQHLAGDGVPLSPDLQRAGAVFRTP